MFIFCMTEVHLGNEGSQVFFASLTESGVCVCESVCVCVCMCVVRHKAVAVRRLNSRDSSYHWPELAQVLFLSRRQVLSR